jgi:predicted MPP superfamily phosphohydrolase
LRRRRLNFILIAQAILLLAHAFVYATWTFFWRAPDPPGVSILAIVFAVLSVSFVAASLLAFRYYNIFVRAIYTAAAAWLGLINFCFLASLLCWLAYAGARLAGASVAPRQLAAIIFSMAIAAALYGTANSYWLRVKHVRVKLPNLPDAWRGRVAALVSDTHLGPIRTDRFSRRVVTVLNGHRPDVVFLAGDLYDGTAANVKLFAKPFADLRAPLGAYFVTGNHEEFSSPSQYIDALAGVGVRALQNERVTIDGLQIVGIHYHELSTPERFRAALREAELDRNVPSILLAHAPNRLWESEQAGVTLQLCGHTHAGQFFPWTLAVLRIYGKFAYGLQQLGNMTVYTSCGAGTWGPPVRLGTNPEVVLFHFD